VNDNEEVVYFVGAWNAKEGRSPTKEELKVAFTKDGVIAVEDEQAEIGAFNVTVTREMEIKILWDCGSNGEYREMRDGIEMQLELP